MKNYFLLSLFLGVLWSSCRPEPLPINPGVDTSEVCQEFDTVLTVGFMAFYSVFLLDIDKDLQPDFEFKLTLSGSNGFGYRSIARFTALRNTAKYFSQLRVDTTFLHRTIMVTHPSNPCDFLVKEYHNCYRTTPEDSVLNTDATLRVLFKPTLPDSTLESSEYRSGESAMYYGGLATMPYLDHLPKPDTNYYHQVLYGSMCDPIPFDEEVYIPVVLEKNGGKRFGWVKIKLESGSDLHIFGSCIYL